MKKLSCLSALSLFLLMSLAHETRAQVITATGSWSPTLTAITEAGNNYASPTLTNLTPQTQLSVSTSSILFGTLPHHYKVYIKRQDSVLNWDTAGLELWARRYDSGGGGGGYLLLVSTILGDYTFKRLTTSDQELFEGYNYGTTARTGIGIMYEIRGVSVKVPAGTYTTQIIYTLAED